MASAAAANVEMSLLFFRLVVWRMNFNSRQFVVKVPQGRILVFQTAVVVPK
jgi:hypothetical protein